MFDLSGRVAVVTGGNGGIGLAMATGLAKAGAEIAIFGRRKDRNEDAQARLSALGVKVSAVEVDVTDEASVASGLDAVMAEHGALHILINNAGTNERKLPQDYSLSEWNSLINVNLTSAFIVSVAAHPLLARSGGGKIINIGSMLSIFGNARAAPYAAAKGGIVQMTKSLAQAWAEDNIQVNAILPGWIETDLTAVAKVQIPRLDENVLNRTPQKRWGKPDDLAGAAVFLASPASDFITGTALPVDGGYSSNT